MKKSQLYIMIALIFSVALFGIYTYTDGYEKASILGVSETTFETEDGQATIWVVPFTQQINATEQITTRDITKDVNNEVNADGQTVEGEITADFTLNVQSLGWETDVVKGVTEPYVNHLEDIEDGYGLDGSVAMSHEYSSAGITYYKRTDETWRVNSVYEPTVTIKGKTYTAGMQQYGKDTSGTRIEVVGDTDKPPIYYEEVMFAFGSQTTTEPQLGNIQIVPYSGTMMFIDADKMKMDGIVDLWNRLLDGRTTTGTTSIGDYRENIDVNGDKESDMNGFNEDISLEEFVTNTWQYDSEPVWKTVVNPIDYEYTTSSGHPVDYDQYKLQTGGDASLIYATPMMIIGTWYIPVEYGDVVITEANPIPEITAFGAIGDLTDDGTGSYSVTVKCVEGSGRISVQLIQDAAKEVPITIEPDSIQSESFKEGDEKTITFNLIGNDIAANDENVFMIVATGSGGAQDIKYDTLKMIDADAYSDEDKVSITVNAVTQNGDLLSTHPVIINGDTQYGTWTGKVIPNIDIEVTGKEFENYVPKPAQTIKASQNEQSFNFVYQPATGANTGGTNWWIIGTVGAIVIILLAGSVYFLTKGKK